MSDIFSNINLAPFLLSLKLAGVTTLILFTIGLPFAWFLSQSKSATKPFWEALTALPIVLPPSVLGFYILIALSPHSALGSFLKESFDVSLLFNFTGLVIASCLYSLPFMVQPLQSGFESLDRHILEASYVSGKGAWTTLFKVALPSIKPALLTAVIITFAHTVGEFGVVLMVGGSIPQETKVASVAIYEMVETMDYAAAHLYSGLMIAVSFVVLVSVYLFNGKRQHKVGF